MRAKLAVAPKGTWCKWCGLDLMAGHPAMAWRRLLRRTRLIHLHCHNAMRYERRHGVPA